MVVPRISPPLLFANARLSPLSTRRRYATLLPPCVLGAGALRAVEQLLVLPVPLSFEGFVRHEAESGRVDAIPQAPLFGRPVVEDVAEVAVTMARADLGAGHAVAPV